MTDLHSHLLPAIDDGAATLEESLRMLDEWMRLGYQKIITTPHVSNWYPNTRERILGQYYNLLDVIEEKKLPITLEVSGEYKLEPELLNMAAANELMPFGNQDYLLVELPWRPPADPAREIGPVMDALLDQGYELILAHPERQDWIQHSNLNLTMLKEKGIHFQLNLLSLIGKYGKPAKKTAEKIIKNGDYSFIGTDAHDSQDLREIRKVLEGKLYRKLMDSGTIKNHDL